jgi:RimJ/RimL family protein N-acetyltransferase
VDTVSYETERLTVRLWTEADVDRIHDLYSQWEVIRWIGGQPGVLPDRAETLDRIQRWRALHDNDQRFGCWAVEVRDTGLIAGTVLFKPLPNGDGEVEVGWHLHPDSWGHGYATESATGAIERGFAAGLPEVYAVVRPGNDRSLAVCRRLGMRPLGRTDRWYGVELEAFRITKSGYGTIGA